MSDKNRKYLLDANILITAHRLYYSFDICPGFWQCLLHYHSTNTVFSIDKVKSEIMNGKTKRDQLDALALWVKDSVPNKMFLSSDDIPVDNKYKEIVNHVQSSDYKDFAKTEFANVADGWIIAYASVNNYVVVTQEILNPNRKSKVQLPNICKHFGVEYIDTFSLLRTLNIRYNWNL